MEVGSQCRDPATFLPGKRLGTHLQEFKWAPGQAWSLVENLALTTNSYPDRPARSESLY